jgi:hypothetical protein
VKRGWARAAPPGGGPPPRGGGPPAPQNTTDSHSETLCIELVLHPPTPYTLSPLLKGGEGRGEGGSYIHVPCPFGALLVTLYHFKSKAFLMLRRRWACPPEGGAAATPNSTLLHSETLCPQLVLAAYIPLNPPAPSSIYYAAQPLFKKTSSPKL